MEDIEDPKPEDYRILVVDNDPAHARAMTESLEKTGYPCTVATNGPEGSRRIASEQFDIVITDMVMNDVDGMQILEESKKRLPDCETIMVTGHATVPKAVQAMQQGAFTFLEKPITPARLRATTAKAAQAVQLKKENNELRQRLDERFGFEGIVYTSAVMQNLIDRLKRIAPTDADGIDYRGIGYGQGTHCASDPPQNSPRRGKRIVEINTRAVSENLVESELFGHKKGAFTDAVTDRVGAFEFADGGSLFLDEVGDMPMSTQIKLLRVLEENKITRVGDNKAIKVNVRLISATNRPLEEMVDAGTFRNDLYFRLKVVTVNLPPLRERREDIIPLMDHFRKIFLKRHNKPTAHFTPEVTKQLLQQEWKGNIRELRNCVENMVVLDFDGKLGMDDLPQGLVEVPIDDSVPPPTMTDAEGPTSLIGKPLADIERWAIEETLGLCGGNREEAAKVLGIGSRTLYRRLDQYKKEEEQTSDGANTAESDAESS